ncbi:MAG TPA: hypothetical protein VN444_04275 [Verrucomicrobiae bacterium]|nr:hypothetical protein [Verrucomicrobiae bacterium]
MNKLYLFGAFILLALASTVEAHKGYHYAGLAGTAPTDYTAAGMMMPHSPIDISKHSHAIGWTILWDAYDTGQFVEIGIGYNRAESKKVVLWWASPQHPTIKKVASVPFGTWVDVSLRKVPGEPYVIATWTWSGNEITKRIAVPGWTSNVGYHPTKAEIYSKKSDHPNNVEIRFEDVTTAPGDTLRWHIEGPWEPYGDYSTFTVR